MQQPGRARIGNLWVHQLSTREVLDRIAAWGRARAPAYVCFANAHMVYEGYRNPAFAAMVNRAAIVAADGVPIAKSFTLLYGLRQERVAGMDMMAKIIAHCEQQQLSLFLFGSTDEVLAAVIGRIRKLHPHLELAGSLSPAFGKWSPDDGQYYLETIRRSGARVVLVSLGCPKQETWMSQHSGRLNAVLIGIGGVFAVYGGLRKRAPYWMQKWSLEWLYRLAQEPGRMFKRYFVSNTLFIALIFRQWLQLKKGRKF